MTLAEFLKELEKDEIWLLQRQHDLEEQPLREELLLAGSRPMQESQPKSATAIELDLSHLPRYEVYH